MKGIIFTEFLEMIEEKFGYEMVDNIIREAEDPQDGAYTSVNTYDHKQLVNMVLALQKQTKLPLRELLLVYGRYLFGRLATHYPQLLEGTDSCLDLLLNIELLIHTEVRKLYPEANPPRFKGVRIDDNTIELLYHSHRSMGDVAEGLMLGCADHFGENLDIKQVKQDEGGQKVLFLVQKLRND